MDIVYLDELLFLNLLTDYLLLLSAAVLRGLPLRRRRFAAGAAAGAAYAGVCVLPGCRALGSPPVLLGVSALMAFIAYGRRGFWRSWACLLALSAAFGGAVYGCSLLAGESRGRGGVAGVSLRTLLLSFGVFYALLRLALQRALPKRRRAMAEVTLTLLGRSVRFTALRDTGNGLYDPVSGRHVLVAESRALESVLPPGLTAESADAPAFLRALEPWPELARRFRLVPYRAVGAVNGLLPCFRPDALLLDGEREELLVGVSPTCFSEQGEFQAIV